MTRKVTGKKQVLSNPEDPESELIETYEPIEFVISTQSTKEGKNEENNINFNSWFFTHWG